MNKYWSDNLDSLTPYVAGEQPRDRSYIKLNTNESPYPPSEAVLDAIREAASDRLRFYPDPAATGLKQAVAGHYDIGVENVFAGNGSDEVLGFAFQALFKKQSPVLFPDITYSFYPVYCRLFGIDYRTFPLTDRFEVDPQLISGQYAGIIIANPNAPTGVSMDLEQIESLLDSHSDSVILIDEAYVDFGAQSCVSMIKKYPNLLVVQTLSKSRSLAGLRVGLAIADAGLIEAIERVKNSFNAYPVDSLAIAGGVAAFNDKSTFRENTRRVIEAREWTTEKLEGLSFYVIPSRANFIMAQHKSIPAKDLYLKLREDGILVRYFDMPRINNFLRITIGTMDEMQSLLNALRKISG